MNDTSVNQNRPSGEIGALTRDALLQAARTVFARNGFDGASVRMITSTAAVNLGAITYHFGSKRGLYDAVLSAELHPLRDRVRRTVGSEGTALDRMIRVTEAYFEYLAQHPDLPHLLLQEVAAGRQPPGPVVDVLSDVLGMLLALHQEGQRDGSIRPGHPGFAALSALAQPIYLTLIAPVLSSIGNIDLGDQTIRDQATRHMKEFVRRGLAPDEAPLS